MSVTDADPAPDPRNDPEAVIREELGEYRETVEALADLDLGVLSEDARRVLEVLGQEESA